MRQSRQSSHWICSRQEPYRSPTPAATMRMMAAEATLASTVRQGLMHRRLWLACPASNCSARLSQVQRNLQAAGIIVTTPYISLVPPTSGHHPPLCQRQADQTAILLFCSQTLRTHSRLWFCNPFLCARLSILGSQALFKYIRTANYRYTVDGMNRGPLWIRERKATCTRCLERVLSKTGWIGHDLKKVAGDQESMGLPTDYIVGCGVLLLEGCGPFCRPARSDKSPSRARERMRAWRTDGYVEAAS